MKCVAMVTWRAIGQHGMRVVGKFLDEAEDVIPAAAVQPGGVLAQLVENLVHFKAGQDGLDEHGALDGALRQADLLLRADEDVVPEPRLQMALHLGQIEVRAAAARQQLFGVVKEVEAEIEDGAGHRLAIHAHMPFFKVPAARADKQHGGLVVELVLLSRGRVGVGDGAPDGIAQIDLAVEQVVPCRRIGVFEVGHEDFRAGVERVDNHLAIDGAGDLHAAVENIGGQRRNGPCGLADGLRLGEKVWLFAGIEPLLPLVAGVEQRLAARVERALQDRQ